MRVVSSFYFILVLPLVLFALAVLYSPVIPTIIKQEMIKVNLYERLAESPNPDNPDTNDPIFFAIGENYTPAYIQLKLEKAIDDTFLWITRKTDNLPILSFKDLADELMARDPQLKTHVEEIAQKPLPPDEKIDPWSNEVMTKKFIESGFSYQLKDIFFPFRNLYTFLTFSLPFTILSLLTCLFGLFYLNHTASDKLRWLGITFCISSIWSLGVFALIRFLSQRILDFFGGVKEDIMMQIAYPALNRLLTLFINHYASMQITTSIILLGAGIICILIASQTKKK